MPSISAGVAYVDILPNLKKFGKELQKQTAGAGSGLKKFGDKLSKAGNKLTVGLTLPLVALGKVAFDAASGLNEQISKTNVVFGKSADSVQAWSKTTIDALGLSRRHALEAVGTFGNLFVGMKLGEKPAADMSKKLVALASDLASFNDVPIEEALLALRSGLVGETEPLRKFAVNLNDAALRQKALELGLVKTTKEVLPPAIKAQASYALILEQTKTAQGDYARTSGSAANQARTLKERFDEASATIGQQLLPVGIKLIGFASDLLQKFQNLSPGTQDLVLKLGLVAVAMGPIVKIGGTVAKTMGALKKGFALARTAILKFTGAKLAEKTALEANNKTAIAGTAATGKLGGAVKGATGALKNIGKALPIVALGVAGMEAGFASAREETKKNAELVKNKLVPAYLAGTLSAGKLAEVQKIMEISGNKAALAAINQAIAQKKAASATSAHWTEVQKLSIAVVKLPPYKAVKITTPGMQAALDNLNSLRDKLGDIGSVGITFFTNKLEGQASGGPVYAGGTYLVGEKGPELLQMGSSSGQIIPNHALGSAGGDIIFNITGADPAAIAWAVERKLRQVGISAAARVRMRSRIGARP